MKKIILLNSLIIFITISTISQEIKDRRFIQLAGGLGFMNQEYTGLSIPIMLTPRTILYDFDDDFSLSLSAPISISMMYMMTEYEYRYLHYINLPLVLELNFFLGANTFKSANRKTGFLFGFGVNYTKFDEDGPWNNFEYICPVYTIGFNWRVGRRSMGIRFANNIYNKYKGFSTYILGVQYHIFK